ncbi:MAG: prepilin peptidase [Lachnospiraceae bacterium]|nr:prepilin peptidase [Lachnospiraceae bacterium]
MLHAILFWGAFQKGCLLALTTLAAFFDLKKRRIPNFLILAGLIAGLVLHLSVVPYAGAAPLIDMIVGMLIPLVPGFLLFCFHTAGAGDIKLLMAVGALLGRASIGHFTWICLLVAALFSLFVIAESKNGRQCFSAFGRWVRTCLITRSLISYPIHTSLTFPFAVPVFITSVLYCAGILAR